MKEISNDVFCELSQEELLTVTGGNRMASTTLGVTGRLLLKTAPSVSIVATPAMGALFCAMGVSFLGLSYLSKKESQMAY